jgi:hypothetical protein
VLKLLKKGEGDFWNMSHGRNNASCYDPINTSIGSTSSPVIPPYKGGGNRQTGNCPKNEESKAIHDKTTKKPANTWFASFSDIPKTNRKTGSETVGPIDPNNSGFPGQVIDLTADDVEVQI